MLKKPILVVRQETLQNDLDELEIYLGGNNSKWQAADSNHFLTGRVGSSLSTEATRILCCALKVELLIYQTLIKHALNLNSQAKKESIDQSFQLCGIKYSLEELSCPDQN